MAKSNPLHQLASQYGVQTSYEAADRSIREASTETLLATLRALGAGTDSLNDVPDALEKRLEVLAKRGLSPCHVAWNGNAGHLDLELTTEIRGAIDLRILLEDGTEFRHEQRLEDLQIKGSNSVCGRDYVTRQIMLPNAMPLGYHRIELTTSAGLLQSLLVSAPSEASARAGEVGRNWGAFLPLYALQSANNWGAGDYTDLGNLAAWIGGQGGRILGTLPLLASDLIPPCDPSPYSPISRLFWNEFYIDVPAIPEFAENAVAQNLFQQEDFQVEMQSLRETSSVRYAAQMALKRRILEVLAAEMFQTQEGTRRAGLASYIAAHPGLEDYARFRAATEKSGTNWTNWPERQRNGVLHPEDYDEAVVRYHIYVQWIAAEQLSNAFDRGQQQGCSLYLDLPLGVRQTGYDVWRHRDVFALQAEAGAPPDPVYTRGQGWGFPPLHPDAIRVHGYRYVIAYLRRHLQHAHLLRIDHVMGLHRLFWIPAGLTPAEGAYVQYSADEWYAILCLESLRHAACIVGENLGTVPEVVNQSMARHRLRQLSVVQYELESPDRIEIDPPPIESLASLNTHDMPPFAGFLKGDDIRDRQQLGLLTESQAERDLEVRQRACRNFALQLRKEQLLGHSDAAGCDTTETEPSPQELVQAALKHLAIGRAEMMLVNLEDLWLEDLPQNVPGTGEERPNWKRKAQFSFDRISTEPEISQVLSEVNRLRREPVP